ncbi:MAG: type I-E CRISPR-associated protein Cas6/Cse3/CasE [Methylococcaceae bacterium]|nr:type I-E CRISPR-associated protein Cas6/Cse3/CasE [Methylococcaceae bacterium]
MYFSRITLRPEILKSSQLNRVLEDNVYGAHRLLWDLFSEQTRNYIYREEIAREQLGNASNVRGESIYYMVSKSKPTEPEHSLFKVETKGYQPQLIEGQVLNFECRVNPVVTRNAKKHDVVMDAQLVFLKELIEQLGFANGLVVQPTKKDYKKQLLTHGGEPLKQRLVNGLVGNSRYSERLQQVSTLTDLLEWAIKAQVEAALENWWKRQGERCGFELLADDLGLTKLQTSSYQWHAMPSKGKRAGFSSIDFMGQLQITDIDKLKKALFDGIGRSKAFGCGLLMIKRV